MLDIQEAILEILPFVKCAAEATALISVTIICMKLDTAVSGLLALIEHRLLLDDRYKNALSCDNRTAICPFLQTYLSSIDSRVRVIEGVIREILYKLESYRSSVQQYGEQNYSIAIELAENHITELAEQKKKIARKELKICRQIQTVILQSATLTSKSNEETSLPSAILPSHYLKGDVDTMTEKEKERENNDNNMSSSSSSKSMPSPILIAPECL